MADVVRIGDATLYHGDCLEILPTLPKVDAVITDPPYGIGAGEMSLGKWRTSRMEKLAWDAAAPSFAHFEAVMAAAPLQVIWGGNYFALPPSRCFFVWDKGAGFRGRDFAECEVAWASMDANARIFSYDPLARGDYRDKEHPTQKPARLMQWCIERAGMPQSVIDPFMGSGTTGVACANLGRKFFGIEIERKYFDIACERIDNAYRQQRLFG